ncbi:trichohyalin-like isoform X2 [Haliotis rufescens]|nr:trichohyalin-like isoform X2 [Haliotis rufescens]XP_046375403.2 trichohyalin-like isoform X2 [Haliotis rufescens]
MDRLAAPRRQKVFSRSLLPLGDSLPYWSTLSLDSKLPVAPSPRGSYTLFTTEIGQPKYINRQKYDFDLTDPLGNATPAEYDSLQDPFLKHHFQKPPTKRILLGNGLITKDSKITCSVKEFNEYREYLRHRSVTDFNLKRHRKLEQEASRRRSREAQSESDLTERDEQRRNSILRARLDMYNRSESLVSRLKRRESLLSFRMEEKRHQHVADTERRIRDSWEERKRRQQQMLERENEIEQMDLNRKREQLEQREKTLVRQREQQLARLEKIKAEYLKGKEKKFGKRSRLDSLDRSNQSQRETIPHVDKSTNQKSVKPEGSAEIVDNKEPTKEKRSSEKEENDKTKEGVNQE